MVRGISLRASATARGCVAPTTAPTDERPDLADECPRPTRRRARDVVPHRAAVLQHHVLEVAAGVRRAHDARRCPTPPRRTAPRKGSTESRPSHGLTVSASARGGSPSRYAVAVGARGRADVAALAVGDHEQARAARVGAHLVEGRHARRARAPRRTRAAASPRPRAARRRRRCRSRNGRRRRAARPASGRGAGRARRRAAIACARPRRRAGRRRCMVATAIAPER